MRHLVRIALSMPPHVAARKAIAFGLRLVRSRVAGRILRGRCTYAQAVGRLESRLGPLDPKLIRPVAEILKVQAAHWRCHRFNLLGSGWVRVVRGERYAGFGPWRYDMAMPLVPDWRGAIVAGHWPGNRQRARFLLEMIDDPSWSPVDWQVDFKSGYRWSARTPGTSVPYGHQPGVDVKVPWELARLQHLPQMALLYAVDRDPALVREFRNQALDFLGSNPPGWGVNWACAMDVAIRAANICVAWDLFTAHGAAFDVAFEGELGAAMLAHGRDVVARLEWNERHRGNHYLADICGLLFIAAYLPCSPEADTWLVFAVHQLAAEIPRQFGPDGANFEASTAYHRLSAEMALFSVALTLGLPPHKRQALEDYDAGRWRRHPPLPPAPLPWPPFGADALERLARAARFACDITKPSGDIVQVGDNDSGRFLVLSPGGRDLDLSALGNATAGLFEGQTAETMEAAVVASLTRGLRLPAPNTVSVGSLPPRPMPESVARCVTRLRLIPPDGTALEGLEPVAYPDFGLFIWRSARTFLSVRCGPVGQNGNGGHAHNDQLAVELEIDGVAWARDPGTFVYTPDLSARDAYRSVLAHFAPREGTQEPARMIAPFRLEDRARAQVLRFDAQGFVGVHSGFGAPVFRRVSIEAGGITIEDDHGGAEIGAATQVEDHLLRSPVELACLWGLDRPFSPGYGLQCLT